MNVERIVSSGNPSAVAALQAADYPALYQLADASSMSAQRWYKRLTAIELLLALAGAAAGALAVVGGADWRTSATAAAVSFLGAGAAKLLTRVRGHERDWFNGRAVAETVKSLTWRYVTQAPPFGDEVTADARLIEQVGEAIRLRPLERPRPGALPPAARQITPAMRDGRRLPLTDRRDRYVEARVYEQADWYRRRAIAGERARDLWFFVSLGAHGAAVLLATAGVFAEDVARLNLLGLAAAIAAAATAWAQVGRFDEQSRAYALASQELLLIASLAPAVTDEAGLGRLVATAESAISREHTLWVAKRTDQWLVEPAPADVSG